MNSQALIACTKLLPLALFISLTAGAAQAPTPTSPNPARAASILVYPPAKRGNVVDDYNGIKVSDPYRWLEELDSTETRQWVKAQARLTESFLGKIAARKALKQRLTELRNFERYGLPFHEGNRYFYTHNRGLQQQSILYTTVGLDAAASVAFDPNTLSTNGSLAIAGYVASLDGAKLAYGVSQGGSDWTEWHIRDLASGKDLPDVLRWTKYYRPAFAPDGKGLYYSGFPAPPKGEELRARDLNDAVFYHALGTPQSADRKLYERPDHPDWQFDPHLTRDGHWLVITVGEGQVGDKGLENVYALDLTSSLATVAPLAEGFDAAYIYVGADNGLLYFQTTLDAPRGRIIAINPTDVAQASSPASSRSVSPGVPSDGKTPPAPGAGTAALHPARSRWKDVVPQGVDSMDIADGSVTLVGHQLIVGTLYDACSKVTVFGLDGKMQREVLLPGRGSAWGFGGKPDDTETFYAFTDLVTPPTIFRLDLETGASSLYRVPKLPFDCSTLESKQVFYSVKDGTRIPMSIVHKKGLKLNGSNPTLLYAYGGFGISVLPYFDPSRLVWLERGGVFAVANIRGGGEYGEEWHRQAIRTHKQIVFDDFIAAAEWLIAQRYTSTSKLAIEGGSNGGLLVGACVTQRPDLFGAALAYVGVMDMLRFDQFGQGAGWVGDYGSPHNPEDFKALYAYSPYHSVRAGMRYPATLVITGDHDTRVMPAHSFKFAAALQAAQAGPAPVLLCVRLSTGHGAGPTTSKMIEETADAYAFLLANLGLEPR